MTKKDSELPASTTANLTTVSFWVIVDKLGASVKATIAQMVTSYGAIKSIVGDITATMAGGVATSTIGAGKVTTGMVAAANVTYAKIQDVANNRLIGPFEYWLGGTIPIAECTPAPSDFLISAGQLAFSAPVATHFAPSMLAADGSALGNALENISLSASVSASTLYYFEFYVLHYLDDSVPPIDAGYAFTVSCPASPNAFYFETAYGLNGTTTYGLNNIVSARGSASDGSTKQTSGHVDNTEIHLARVRGMLWNGSNAGTLQLRGRVYDGDMVCYAKKGSWLRLTRLV